MVDETKTISIEINCPHCNVTIDVKKEVKRNTTVAIECPNCKSIFGHIVGERFFENF